MIICRDGAELARNAAEHFTALAGAAIARRGRFTAALSGGSTPRALYSLLSSAEFCGRTDWPRVHLFFGDERCVPPDHPESNFRMVEETLLEGGRIPASNVHRMAGEKEPAEAAAAYETELRNFFASAGGRRPRLDLILLGLGEDGHTASLFPGTAALDETERWVTAVYVEKLQSYRLTLTLPLINAAAQATFLVSGPGKAAVLERILGAPGVDDYPAARVRPDKGALTWLMTQDAAAGLAGQSRGF